MSIRVDQVSIVRITQKKKKRPTIIRLLHNKSLFDFVKWVCGVIFMVFVVLIMFLFPFTDANIYILYLIRKYILIFFIFFYVLFVCYIFSTIFVRCFRACYKKRYREKLPTLHHAVPCAIQYPVPPSTMCRKIAHFYNIYLYVVERLND